MRSKSIIVREVIPNLEMFLTTSQPIPPAPTSKTLTDANFYTILVPRTSYRGDFLRVYFMPN